MVGVFATASSAADPMRANMPASDSPDSSASAAARAIQSITVSMVPLDRVRDGLVRGGPGLGQRVHHFGSSERFRAVQAYG